MVLEYHHPEALPPGGTYVVRVASILQVRPSSSEQRLARQRYAHMHPAVLPWTSLSACRRQPNKQHYCMQGSRGTWPEQKGAEIHEACAAEACACPAVTDWTQCVAHLQGLSGSLPEAAEAARRRRKLLLWNDDRGYTPGAGFDMSLLQVPTIDSCMSIPPKQAGREFVHPERGVRYVLRQVSVWDFALCQQAWHGCPEQGAKAAVHASAAAGR